MITEPEILSLNNFNKGWITRLPDTRIPDEAFSNVQNIELNEKYLPTKCKGQIKYNSSSLGTNKTQGIYVYTMADGAKYYVAPCGGKLYISVAGSGTYTAVKITRGATTEDMTFD